MCHLHLFLLPAFLPTVHSRKKITIQTITSKSKKRYWNWKLTKFVNDKKVPIVGIDARWIYRINNTFDYWNHFGSICLILSKKAPLPFLKRPCIKRDNMSFYTTKNDLFFLTEKREKYIMAITNNDDIVGQMNNWKNQSK